MTSPTKNQKPPKISSLQTKRLVNSFEGLKSSLEQSNGELELQSGTKIMAPWVISKYNIFVHWQRTC